MSKQEFNCTNDHVISSALQAVSEIKPGDKKVVTISTVKDARSGAQHRLKWMWMQQLERNASGVGKGLNNEEWNDWLKAKFMPPILKAKDEYWVSWFSKAREIYSQVQDKDALMLMIGKSLNTSDLNVGEMSEFMDKIDRYALEKLGVKLITPADMARQIRG